METGAYDDAWPYVHMHPAQTLQAHLDLKGKWLMPIHNGTFDLAMHSWHEPFDKILALANQHKVRLSTPKMGEMMTLENMHEGTRWWQSLREPPE